jgi:two-component system, NarL family, sensor kinase
MKPLLTLFAFWLLPFFCFSQTKIYDLLIKKIKETKEPNAKVDLLNTLAYEMRVTNADSAIKIANESLKLAQKNNYLHGAGTANLCIAFANATKANYAIDLDYANKAFDIAKEIKDDSLMAYALLGIASYHYNTSNYDKAIEHALQGIKIFESKKNVTGIVKTKVLMSQVYQLKDDLTKSEKILQECLQLFPSINDGKTKSTILHTLANVYGMQEKYKEALVLDEQGLKLCEAENLFFLKSQFLDNMANCYMYSGRYEEAKKYFNQSLLIDSSFENKKQMSDTYLNLGNLSMMQKKYEDARKYFLYSIFLANISGYKQGKYQALQLLSETYSNFGNHDEAMTTLKKAYKLKDSIINEKSENKLIELETVYETEKKEQQLKLQQIKISRKNYLIGGLGIAALSLVLFGFTFYKKREAQNKLALQKEVLHQQEIATKAVLEAEEKERQRIARDLHDGVGQVMSAAKMNLSAFENELNFKDEHQKMQFEKVINLVDEGCKEVRHVSHQMMPNALLKAGLSSAIKEFIDKIDSKTLKVNLYTEGLNERLDNNIETVLYRVIQECVNNVIKHSGANILEISLIKDIDGISATVEDNGKGFDSKLNINNEGIGLKNIRTRIEYLKGTVDFDSAEGKGTLVAIHVPVA